MTTLDPRTLYALKNNQRQLDMDGVEVGVSRQALDELLSAYAALSQPQATAPAGEGMVTEAPVVGDRKRIDDALVSCAGLLRTLCHDEIGDTAAAELEYVRSCIIPAAAPAPGVVWQATEATDAMWEAARGRNSFAASYRAMIAAAPASPQPANLAQVTDAIRGIVEDALNSAIPEPWEVAEHATQRILAAIGAGGQAVADDIGDAVLAWMVKYDLLDGDNEYQVADVMAVMDDLVPSSALSQPHPAEAKLAKVEAELATEKEAHRLTRVAEFAKISYRDKRFAEMEAKIGRISAELAEARKREELARIVIGDLLADHAPIGLRGIQALNKAVSFLASKESSQ